MFPLVLTVCGKLPREEVVARHAQLIADRLSGLEALKSWKVARHLEEAYNPPIIVNALLLPSSHEVRTP